ncbi:GNAT family N-acetyltransferase [Lachnoclostridium phytofermentans]|uniref:GCN5-related N-acetyltransferase n=1 Tax=Lachnoclostridium phytofermentans (strain ATCC 700394 / DSM 18823 / ISDg) TaxID=357809 RepID=A9KJ85_LACP7|nr:GNAT family N-acetyltransferase [Lachnoclostridium phytofermentans]ABX42497.1 GCN5-related N-acetyltransferase [Lachnoclostridium phytofermentans ISDg]
MKFKRDYYKPENERALCDFFEQMNNDSNCNTSRIVWELLRNAPYFEMFQLDKIGLWYEDNNLVASLQLLSPWPGSVIVDNRSDIENLLLDIIHYAEETFCGLKENKKHLVFYVDEKEDNLRTQTGLLEPMVTAKEYRKSGLGKACVYNSIKILQSYGCKKVFVDPDEEPYNYYCKIGFEGMDYTQCYEKVFE